MNGYLRTLRPYPAAIFLGSSSNLLMFKALTVLKATGYLFNIGMPQTQLSLIRDVLRPLPATQNCQTLLIQWCLHTRRQALRHAGCKTTKMVVFVHAISLHLCHTLFACIGIKFLIQRGDMETLLPRLCIQSRTIVQRFQNPRVFKVLSEILHVQEDKQTTFATLMRE